MQSILQITLLGLFVGIFGTGIGGCLSFLVKKDSPMFLSFILDYSAGLMLGVVCFGLLPEAFGISGVSITCWGVVFGTVLIIVLDSAVKKMEFVTKQEKNNSLLKTGVLVAVGISLHNFPEGIAIGSSFEAYLNLGMSIALVVLIHDIPEGMAVAVPLRASGLRGNRVMFLTLLSGIPTAIGAFVGALLGEISAEVVTFCLGFAGGAMLYIVCSELIPEAKNIYKGTLSPLGNLAGVLTGIFLSLI